MGGMAEVFKAQKLGPEGFSRTLAIKRVLQQYSADDSFKLQFIDEAKLVAGLNHRNIIQIYDFGRVEEMYFIGMEYVKGRDLTALIRSCVDNQELLDLNIGLHIVMETLRGLGFAHKATDPQGHPLNLVHRDVSPSNVLLSFEGEVKVCDFGIAKAAHSTNITAAGMVKGKLRYLAPESLDQESKLDNRADIFAVGLMLYEVLAARQCIHGEHPAAILGMLTSGNLPSLLDARPDISPRVDEIMKKATTLDPDDRYLTCEEMLADIQAYVVEDRVHVGPEALSVFLQRAFKTEIADEADRERSTQTALEELRLSGDLDALTSGEHSIVDVDADSVEIDVGEYEHSGGVRVLPMMLAAMLFLGAAAAAFFIIKPPDMVDFKVVSNPAGAAIIINGLPTGLNTPSVFDNREPNKKFVVALKLDDHKEMTKTITLVSGKENVLDFTLQALPKKVVTKLPPAKRPPRSGNTGPKKAPPPRCTSGTISVVAKGVPWAMVSVDGKQLKGETPMRSVKVKAGTRKIKVWHPGTGKSKTVSMKIKGCANNPVRVQLK